MHCLLAVSFTCVCLRLAFICWKGQHFILFDPFQQIKANRKQTQVKLTASKQCIRRSAFGVLPLLPSVLYVRSDNPAGRKRRNRPNIIWFNPPYSVNVHTNVARSFLCLIIDKHFPKSHSLHESFNRNNVKVGYSCMNNMARVIKSHNAKILGKDDQSPAYNNQCNCRKKDLCPLDGACQVVNNIVHKATVTTVLLICLFDSESIIPRVIILDIFLIAKTTN